MMIVMPHATRVLVEFFTDHLPAEFADVQVLGRTPNPRPVRWLHVRRVGGFRRDIVTEVSTLTLEGWSGTETAPQPDDAQDICQIARAVLWAARGTVIGSTVPTTLSRVVDIAGPADLPDPVSGQPRCTSTVQVALRGAPFTGS